MNWRPFVDVGTEFRVDDEGGGMITDSGVGVNGKVERLNDINQLRQPRVSHFW